VFVVLLRLQLSEAMYYVFGEGCWLAFCLVKGPWASGRVDWTGLYGARKIYHTRSCFLKAM